jgi:hypothetical protein
VAVGAAQFDAADLSACVVAVQDWWAGLASKPLVPPRDHHHEQVDEFSALVGQDVLVSRSSVVGPAFEDTVLDEVVESLGQDLA